MTDHQRPDSEPANEAMDVLIAVRHPLGTRALAVGHRMAAPAQRYERARSQYWQALEDGHQRIADRHWRVMIQADKVFTQIGREFDELIDPLYQVDPELADRVTSYIWHTVIGY
ncbi:hypothetical protein [Actinomadura miaoliensis]